VDNFFRECHRSLDLPTFDGHGRPFRGVGRRVGDGSRSWVPSSEPACWLPRPWTASSRSATSTAADLGRLHRVRLHGARLFRQRGRSQTPPGRGPHPPGHSQAGNAQLAGRERATRGTGTRNSRDGGLGPRQILGNTGKSRKRRTGWLGPPGAAVRSPPGGPSPRSPPVVPLWTVWGAGASAVPLSCDRFVRAGQRRSLIVRRRRGRRSAVRRRRRRRCGTGGPL